MKSANRIGGGGALKISTPGAIRHDGSIEMSGGEATEASGSGGSVWLTSATLSGGGTIAANGGHVSNGGNTRSAGSGGRVAIHQGAVAGRGAFAGTVQACGYVSAGTVNGHTLTILSRKHRDKRGWPANAVVEDGGQIIWRGTGLALVVK